MLAERNYKTLSCSEITASQIQLKAGCRGRHPLHFDIFCTDTPPSPVRVVAMKRAFGTRKVYLLRSNNLPAKQSFAIYLLHSKTKNRHRCVCFYVFSYLNLYWLQPLYVTTPGDVKLSLALRYETVLFVTR